MYKTIKLNNAATNPEAWIITHVKWAQKSDFLIWLNIILLHELIQKVKKNISNKTCKISTSGEDAKDTFGKQRKFSVCEKIFCGFRRLKFWSRVFWEIGLLWKS